MSRLASISGRTPGPINPAIHFPIGAQVTIGHDRNRTSGSAYNRHSGGFLLGKQFLLEAILWDIFAAATYTISLVSDLTASPTTLTTLATDVSLTGGSAENTIEIAPIILQPGLHYLSLYTSTAVKVEDNTGVTAPINEYFILWNTSYDGGFSGQYTLPIKLRGYVYQ